MTLYVKISACCVAFAFGIVKKLTVRSLLGTLFKDIPMQGTFPAERKIALIMPTSCNNLSGKRCRQVRREWEEIVSNDDRGQEWKESINLGAINEGGPNVKEFSTGIYLRKYISTN